MSQVPAENPTATLSPSGVAQVRYAASPLGETVASLRVLGAPVRHPALAGWLHAVGGAVDRLDVRALLVAAEGPLSRWQPSGAVPGSSTADAAAALADELDLALGARPGTARLRSQVAAYWEGAMAPHWHRIGPALLAELEHRARQLAAEGIRGVLRGVGVDLAVADPGAAWLTVVPTVFGGGPHLEVRGDGVLLVYGVPSPWARRAATVPAPRVLGELLGGGRSSVLAALDAPLSTSAVAVDLGLSPATVSGHLAVLLRADLVARRRTGRVVLYQRTGLGERLLEASAAQPVARRA